MFYFFLAYELTCNWLLIASAVIPAIVLMITVYRSDKLEKEDISFLVRLAFSGIAATFISMIIERIGSFILGAAVWQGSPLYDIILYFVIVAFAEEGSKYALLKKRTWNYAGFDCQFDAVVYSVFLSLGFALWENISYVLHYGFGTALVRAVTAIPGHACFGVFMGVFYGLARGHAYMRDEGRSKFFRVLALVIPALIHGTYDYIATMQSYNGSWIFVAFIAVLFVISFILIRRMSKNDRYFNADRHDFTFSGGR